MLLSKTLSNNVIDIDFKAKSDERHLSTKIIKLQQFINAGEIENGLNDLGSYLDGKIAQYLYNKAEELFNINEIEKAKTIYLKLANYRNRRESPELKYYVDQSNFDLGIIYTMENNPEMGKWYGDSLILNSFGIKYGIQFLLATHNEYKIFKKDFQKLDKIFNAQELENIMKCFFIIRKDIAKKRFENNYDIKSFTKEHLLLWSKVIGQEKILDKALISQIEVLAFKFEHILASANAILLGDDFLEIHFIDKMNFNRIGLDKSKDYYMAQLNQYLKAKIVDVRQAKTYFTTRNNYEQEGLYENVREIINTETASDLDILYAFLKNSIFYSQSLLAIAIIKLMKSYNENIVFPESIKKQIKKKLVL